MIWIFLFFIGSQPLNSASIDIQTGTTVEEFSFSEPLSPKIVEFTGSLNQDESCP